MDFIMTYLLGQINVERGKHRLIDQLNQLCILTASIGIATNYFVDGNNPCKEGEHLAVECKQFPREVLLPLYGPVQLAINGQKPDLIKIRFVKSRVIKKTYSTNAPGFRNVLIHAFSAVFTDFYENTKPFLKATFGPHQADWPPLWNFARVVRNACSHNGKLYFENETHSPVKWQHLTYAPSMNGLPIVGGDLSFGDILGLMFELSADLDKRGCAV